MSGAPRSDGQVTVRGGLSRERVVDGNGAEVVRCVKGPAGELGDCRTGGHCAAHGDGPFFCCRCGAEFTAEVGRCRYCGEPRPAGYSVTCGRSECQQRAARRVRRTGRTWGVFEGAELVEGGFFDRAAAERARGGDRCAICGGRIGDGMHVRCAGSGYEGL